VKRLNLNELIWFIILLSFTVYLYYLLSTGKIYFFIHPKMTAQISFSLLAFGILTLFQTIKLFKRNFHTYIKPGFIIFIIPLLLGFIVNPGSISIDVAAQKGVVIAGIGSFNCTQHNHDSHIMRNNKENEEMVDEDSFINQIEAISNDVEGSRGKYVTISGFIYKSDSFKENQFLVGRMLISCCAADAQVAGFMCSMDSGTIPDSGQWVKVYGRVSPVKYIDRHIGAEYTIPLIQVDKIDNIKKPDNQYIYY